MTKSYTQISKQIKRDCLPLTQRINKIPVRITKITNWKIETNHSVISYNNYQLL